MSQGAPCSPRYPVFRMIHRLRPLVALILGAPGLGGCVWAFEPLAYAITGPGISRELTDTGQAIRPGDRLALVVVNPREDAARVAACVAAGIASQLPDGQPVPAIPDADAAARILATFEPLSRSPSLGPAAGVLPPETGMPGFDWIVVIEDQSSRNVTTGMDTSPVPGRPEGDRFEARLGQTTVYHLALRGTIFDLRERRLRGTVQAHIDTQGGAYLIFSGRGTAGAFAPMLEIPAGTGAMTICAAFGRAVGDALARTTPPETPAPP